MRIVFFGGYTFVDAWVKNVKATVLKPVHQNEHNFSVLMVLSLNPRTQGLGGVEKYNEALVKFTTAKGKTG